MHNSQIKLCIIISFWKQTPSTVPTAGCAEERKGETTRSQQKTSLTKVLVFALAEEEAQTLSADQLRKYERSSDQHIFKLNRLAQIDLTDLDSSHFCLGSLSLEGCQDNESSYTSPEVKHLKTTCIHVSVYKQQPAAASRA